jgi:hypothetical protein
MKASSIILSLLFAVTPLFSQTVESPPAKSPVESKVEMVKRDYKDAFLSFALEKAEKYSGAAEIAVNKAVDAATEEAPQLAKEFIIWRAWMHGIKALFPMALLAISIVLFLKQFPRWTLGYGDSLSAGTPLNVIGSVVGGIGCLVGFAITCLSGLGHFLNFVQILVAPRVYVVEQVMTLFGK